MNANEKDLSAAIVELTHEIHSMRETIDAQYSEICALNRNIDKLNKENRDLRKRLSKYEKPDKDSHNSSTPPSKEKMKSEVIRRTKTLRRSTGKKPGGQHGHEGHVKSMVETPDVVESHASCYCEHCGRDLSEDARELDYISQVIDIPAIEPIITEHRHYIVRCACGHVNKGYAPRRRGCSTTFGPKVRAVVTYLSEVQCIPYERLQSLMKEVFGIHLSQGTINNIIKDALKKAQPAIKMIESLLKESPVVGFDESGCYNNKRLDWAWIAQTTYLTLCFRATGRGSIELEKRFGDSMENMIAVTDRHSAYFAINFLDHQVCLAHLLRELEYLSELDPQQQWSSQVKTLLQQAIHERNTEPSKVIEKQSWLKRLDELLKKNLLHLKPEFEKLRKGLVKCRDYIFNFLDNPMIPPDNNASERGIRKLKVKQKISGTFRSDIGADAFFAIHSIADTAWKNKLSPLASIQAILSL